MLNTQTESRVVITHANKTYLVERDVLSKYIPRLDENTGGVVHHNFSKIKRTTRKPLGFGVFRFLGHVLKFPPIQSSVFKFNLDLSNKINLIRLFGSIRRYLLFQRIFRAPITRLVTATKKFSGLVNFKLRHLTPSRFIRPRINLKRGSLMFPYYRASVRKIIIRLNQRALRNLKQFVFKSFKVKNTAIAGLRIKSIRKMNHQKRVFRLAKIRRANVLLRSTINMFRGHYRSPQFPFKKERVKIFKKDFLFLDEHKYSELLKNRVNIFRNLFYMLRSRQFTSSKLFVLSRRLSCLRPKIHSLRYLFRNFLPSRKLFQKRRRKRLIPTHVVVRGTRNNVFLSVTIGHCILFKLTRGFALRYKRRLDAKVGLMPVRMKRGKHDRANKKERRSFVGTRAFDFLADILFRKRILRGLINIYFRGFLPPTVYNSTLRLFSEILSLTLRRRYIVYKKILSAQRNYLIRLRVMLKKAQFRILLLKKLKETNVGLRFFLLNFNVLENNIFFGMRAKFRSKKKLQRLIIASRKVSFFFRGLQHHLRVSLKLKKQPVFTRLNNIFFRPTAAHRYPFRTKKSRRV